MSDNESFSGEKSFEIIQQMISQAKNNITDNGISWLSWGLMIFLASLSTYFLIEFGYQNIFMGWNIFGAFTVAMLSYEFLFPKKKAVRTYVDDVLRLVDIGFTICIFVIIISINLSVSPNSGFGYLLMIFAFLMLVKGGALKFRPLMIGAVINWAGALGIFACREFKYSMLIMAGAVFLGYIIPGILLRLQYKKASIANKGIYHGV